MSQNFTLADVKNFNYIPDECLGDYVLVTLYSGEVQEISPEEWEDLKRQQKN